MGIIAKIGSLIGSGKGIMEGSTDILQAIDGLSTSAEEKAGLRQTVVTGMVSAQAAVIQAEYQHGTWLSKNWRPLIMLSFGAILIYTFFIGPMFGLLVVPLPPELWTMLQLGITGYVGGRSVEKLTAMVMPNLKVMKLKKKLLKTLSPEQVKELFGDE